MRRNKKKIVAIIHTSDVTLKYLNNLFFELAPDIVIRNIVDDSLLQEVIDNGGITKGVIKRICTYAVLAENTIGANLIFTQCSSVGEAADIAVKLVRIPLVKIDERMAEVACKTGTKIGVVATLPTTLGPTVRLIEKTAKDLNKEISITEKLSEGAFQLLRKGNIKKHNQMVIEAIKELSNIVDVIVCAQGSMVTLLDELGEIIIPVLTSPRLGVEHVIDSLNKIEI